MTENEEIGYMVDKGFSAYKETSKGIKYKKDEFEAWPIKGGFQTARLIGGSYQDYLDCNTVEQIFKRCRDLENKVTGEYKLNLVIKSKASMSTLKDIIETRLINMPGVSSIAIEEPESKPKYNFSYNGRVNQSYFESWSFEVTDPDTGVTYTNHIKVLIEMEKFQTTSSLYRVEWDENLTDGAFLTAKEVLKQYLDRQDISHIEGL